MSIIGSAPPSKVIVGGAERPINTSHHCGVRVAAILDDPTADPAAAAAAIVANYFGHVPDDPALAASLFDAGMGFFRCGEPEAADGRGRRKRQLGRVFDWEADAGRVLADFQREYGIDLADPGTHIHWWRFMALFEGLGDTSSTMQAIGTRASDPSDCATKEARDALRRRKKAVALPPRTASEVAPD